MTKDFEQKLKDWEEIHDLFTKMGKIRSMGEAHEIRKEYLTKATQYENKYGEYANPLQRPR